MNTPYGIMSDREYDSFLSNQCTSGRLLGMMGIMPLGMAVGGCQAAIQNAMQAQRLAMQNDLRARGLRYDEGLRGVVDLRADPGCVFAPQPAIPCGDRIPWCGKPFLKKRRWWQRKAA
ncbi:MAG TPA: hypothetical protein VJL29_14590 [Thermoguttaceae bacterium]|nr:hypothetical protein [Thermoguttaceae bacterium]